MLDRILDKLDVLFVRPQTYEQCPDEEHKLVANQTEDEAVATLRQNVARLKIYLLLTLTIASLCVTALAISIWRIKSVQTSSESSRSPPLPEIPYVRKTFERDDLFAGPSTSETDAAWGSIAPVGDGFVEVEDPRQYGLPPGLKPSTEMGGEVYDVSMFHQLHCLSRVRGYLWTMRFAIEKNRTEWAVPVLLDPQEDHIGHCFDYLRQAILCAGDMTLEWPRTEPDGRRFAVDGWHVEHQCRSSESIYDWMKAHTPSYYN